MDLLTRSWTRVIIESIHQADQFSLANLLEVKNKCMKTKKPATSSPRPVDDPNLKPYSNPHVQPGQDPNTDPYSDHHPDIEADPNLEPYVNPDPEPEVDPNLDPYTNPEA